MRDNRQNIVINEYVTSEEDKLESGAFSNAVAILLSSAIANDH